MAHMAASSEILFRTLDDDGVGLQKQLAPYAKYFASHDAADHFESSEYDSLQVNHTWDLQDLPLGCQLIRSKWDLTKSLWLEA